MGRHSARLGSLELTLSDEAADLVSVADTVLKVTEDGWADPVFVGRVNTRSLSYDAESDTLSVTAADPLPHLGQKVIRVFDTASDPDAYIWRAYGSAQPADIMADLIADHAADAGIDIGLTPGGATARELSFPMGSTVLDAVLSLTGLDDSVEFELTPTAAVDGTLVTFNAYYPQQGSDLSGTVALKIGVDGGDNLMDFSYEEAQTDLINRYIVIGDTVGTATRSALEYPLHYAYIAEHAASIAQYGAFESSESASATTVASILEDTAKAVVAANAYPVSTFSGTLDPTSDLDFGPDGDFWIGDVVTVKAGLPQETLTLVGRVATATLTEQPNGEILASLTFELEADIAGVTGSLVNALIAPEDGTAAPPADPPPPPKPPKKKKKKKK